MIQQHDTQPWHHTLAAFDVETTGVDVATSRIVSANVSVLGPDGETLERADWLVNPGVPIPPQAISVHGISDERAQRDGRPAPESVLEIVEKLRGLLGRGIPVVVYNAPYDLTLLRHEAVRHGVEPLRAPAPIIDPLVIDRAVDQYRKGKRTLEVVSEFYGVRLNDAHDAGADAIAAAQVARALVERYPERLTMSAQELHDAQVAWSAAQSASFAEYMRRTHNPNFVESKGWPER